MIPCCLLQLQLLKLLNRLLQAVLLLLGIGQPLLFSFLNGRRHLLLVSRVSKKLLLLLDKGGSLVELLLGFGNLSIHVYTALDVQENGSGSGNRVSNAAKGSGSVRANDFHSLDGLATERLDRRDLVLAGLEGLCVVRLDDDFWFYVS